MLFALSKATVFGINAGIAGVLLLTSGIFVSIASYFLFGEVLLKTQLIGLLVIIVGATIIALFPAGEIETGD